MFYVYLGSSCCNRDPMRSIGQAHQWIFRSVATARRNGTHRQETWTIADESGVVEQQVL